MSTAATAFEFDSAKTFHIQRLQLPLAVYLEIMAHLQQITNIQVELIPQTAPEFDYLQSQVGGLKINCQNVSSTDYPLVTEILNYYEHCYGAWTILP